MEIHLLSKKEIGTSCQGNYRNLKKGIKGIYFLLDSDLNITYIGQSKDIRKRIFDHLTRHNIYFTYFNYVEIYGTQRDLLDREGLYIFKYWDEGIQNKNLDLSSLFIKSMTGIRKASKILFCDYETAKKSLLDVPEYILGDSKYYLRTHLKNKILELQEKGLCVAYGYEFEKL